MNLVKEEIIGWNKNNKGQKADRQELHLIAGIPEIGDIGIEHFYW